jgi:Rha family phage regulatory protein
MNDLVFREKNENWTTSNLIAEKFDKSHKHVLAKIDTLLKDLENLTDETLAVKKKYGRIIKHPEIFKEETFENDRNREYRRYKLNKPAFTLLLMQFSGKKVIELQRTFNQAFYEMEQHILKTSNQSFQLAREQGKQARLEVTDQIKDLVEYATNQGSSSAKFYYSTITKETYKALGFLTKGEKVPSDFRNHLDSMQLAELFIAETIATQEIEKGMKEGLHYKEIYIYAKNKVIEFGKSISSLRLTA